VITDKRQCSITCKYAFEENESFECLFEYLIAILKAQRERERERERVSEREREKREREEREREKRERER
jgi:hypothetical protein